MNKAETKALIELLSRLDVIQLMQHQENIMVIQLIGAVNDVETLSAFITRNKK